MVVQKNSNISLDLLKKTNRNSNVLSTLSLSRIDWYINLKIWNKTSVLILLSEWTSRYDIVNLAQYYQLYSMWM